MSKSAVMISMDSTLSSKAKDKLKGRVSSICEEAIRKELGIVENAPDELKQLQDLLETKTQVQRMAQAEGGETAVRMVAMKLKKEMGEPETVAQKLSFWEKVRLEAQKILIRGRLEGTKKVSPVPLPKNGVGE